MNHCVEKDVVGSAHWTEKGVGDEALVEWDEVLAFDAVGDNRTKDDNPDGFGEVFLVESVRFGFHD